jgi:hypothetical protein
MSGLPWALGSSLTAVTTNQLHSEVVGEPNNMLVFATFSLSSAAQPLCLVSREMRYPAKR